MLLKSESKIVIWQCNLKWKYKKSSENRKR
nr:MAG TPA: hypothetical protein [Caudoviricetes sp.]